jgi:hypothetical protein
MSAMEEVQIGDIYGLMEILEKNVKDPNSKAKYVPMACKCKCIECGKQYYKRPTDLKKGKSSSCRCQTDKATAERNKLNSTVKVGNIYNNIQILEDLGYREQTRGKKESWYRCKCLICGREDYEVNGTNVKYVKSCGCIGSQGELIISQILVQNNINFCREYKFKDLYYKNPSTPLRFDFAILGENNEIKCLIEFDGRQHIKEPEGIWKNNYSLEEIQYRDNLKNEYCKKNNIKLIRIPYTDIKKLNEDYLKSLDVI